jgi:hypothetical protein
MTFRVKAHLFLLLRWSSICIAFPAFGLINQDNGVKEVDAVTQIYVVFGHGWFLWMIKHEVPVESSCD